jgi:hypothetical protein
MTALVEEILNTFDHLTESERSEFIVEILKRVADFNVPPMSDEDLVLNAETIFLELDQQETADE